ncbi:MAG: hypothetical protein J6A01_03720 [Proteobacteria bacterium]|nr:hypothetical protein [Pseudomonadota bacterium]
MNRIILTILLLICFLCIGCHSNDDITGSYEESELSGRHLDGNSREELLWLDGNVERYFRFHFRQFGDEIGGTFETFDLSSRMLFTKIPTYMENTASLYYCARIDRGYIRKYSAYIFFTDREQRQWELVLDTTKDPPAGVLKRSYFNNIGDVNLDNSEYYLREDEEYYQKVDMAQMLYPQIALQRMEKDTKRSLDCVYYYKTHIFEVTLPSEFTDSSGWNCMPTPSRCNNYKLAVVGMMPQHRVPNSENFQLQEILTARLDDCDITTERKRILLLRDNPYKIIAANTSGPYIATVIMYYDINLNDKWDSDSEPILAALDNQTLVFYDSVPGTMYGNALSGNSYEIPVIQEDKFDRSTGWYLFNDDSSEKKDIYRVIQQLTPHSSDTLILKNIALPSDDDIEGCYLNSIGDLPECSGIIPVLLQ